MNNMTVAVVIGALLLGLGALGFATWSGSQNAPNGVAAPMGMGSGMMGSMGSMMQGGNMSGMHGGMMGSMGSMMQGQGMGGMQNDMMGGQNSGPGMMGGPSCNSAPQGPACAPTAPQQSAGNKAGR